MALYEDKKLTWREWSKNANSVKSALMRSLFSIYKREDVAAQTDSTGTSGHKQRRETEKENNVMEKEYNNVVHLGIARDSICTTSKTISHSTSVRILI